MTEAYPSETAVREGAAVPICSALSLELDEAMTGTAPSEAAILVVEVCGPWGRDPAKDVDAPPGVRVQAVRRTLARYEADPRRAWLCGVAADGSRFLEAFDDVRAVDGRVLTEGPTGAGVLEDEPLFLCCTHGTRDACCARLGVPLYRAVCEEVGDRAWHASHLGGHRFAATMAVLPHAVWLGRVPVERAPEVVALARAGRVPLDLLRGFAGRPPAEQVAEIAERRAGAVDAVAARVDVSGWEVSHVRTGRARPLSCGAGAKVEDPGRWDVRRRAETRLR